jgi:hypothetical protein
VNAQRPHDLAVAGGLAVWLLVFVVLLVVIQ